MSIKKESGFCEVKDGKNVAVFCGKTQLESVRGASRTGLDWRLTEQMRFRQQNPGEKRVGEADPSTPLRLAQNDSCAVTCAGAARRFLRRGVRELPGRPRFA